MAENECIFHVARVQSCNSSANYKKRVLPKSVRLKLSWCVFHVNYKQVTAISQSISTSSQSSFEVRIVSYWFGLKCSVKVLYLWSTFSLSKIAANHTCFAIMWIVLEHCSNYICNLRLISSLVEPCWSHNIIRSVSFRQSHHSSWRAASFGKNYFSNSYLFNYLFIFIYSFF